MRTSDSMLSRREAIFGTAATLALAACSRGTDASRVLRVGSQRGGTKAMVLASGVLQGVEFSVEWSEFPAAQTLLEAIGSGAIDLGLTGDAPFQFAYQSGSPIRAVAAQRADQRREGALAIIVPKGSPAHTIVDLVGKRIATTRGSIGHYLILRALERAKLPVSAIRLTYLAPADARAALQSHAIDAWSTWVPYLSAALGDGARVIEDGSSYSPGYGFDVANIPAIEGKPAILADYLAREARALEWALANPGAYAKVLSAETGLPLAIARDMIDKNGRRTLPIDHQVIQDQEIVLATFQRAGEVKAPRPLDQAFQRA